MQWTPAILKTVDDFMLNAALTTNTPLLAKLFLLDNLLGKYISNRFHLQFIPILRKAGKSRKIENF